MPVWSDMFTPTTPMLEVIARASIMYLILFVAMRFLLKREGGAVNIVDLLVVVAIVDGVQPAFTGNAKSISESVVFVVTIIFWSYLLNWLGFHVKALRYLTAGRPVPLVKDGRLCVDNLRQALITRTELASQLRQQGVESWTEVRLAMLEGDGEISVIPFDKGDAQQVGGPPAVA